jgi:hypothetical protein
MQTREFGAVYEVTYNAVVSVFQDRGFTILSTDSKFGLITAQSPEKADSRGLLDTWFGELRSRSSYLQCTAHIERVRENTTEVRLSFVEQTKENFDGGAARNMGRAIQRPEFYGPWFEAIDRAVFIRNGRGITGKN